MAKYMPRGRTEIARQERSLGDLFERAHGVDATDDILVDLTRYICVRTSGYIEQSALALGRSAAEQTSGGIGLSFAGSFLNRAPNPTARELERYLGRFSNKWGEEFSDFLAKEERRSRVNALLGIRNDVAHGKNQGVSLRQAAEYYDLARDVVSWMADRLEPPPGTQPTTTP